MDRMRGVQGWLSQRGGAHVVEDDADKEVEGDAEEVDDGGAHLLGHVRRAHLHHARPEQAHAELKHAERHQLDLPLKGDACTVQQLLISILMLQRYSSTHPMASRDSFLCQVFQ